MITPEQLAQGDSINIKPMKVHIKILNTLNLHEGPCQNHKLFHKSCSLALNFFPEKFETVSCLLYIISIALNVLFCLVWFGFSNFVDSVKKKKFCTLDLFP